MNGQEYALGVEPTELAAEVCLSVPHSPTLWLPAAGICSSGPETFPPEPQQSLCHVPATGRKARGFNASLPPPLIALGQLLSSLVCQSPDSFVPWVG